MKRQAYQHPELRDANDSIIQEGTYGKTSPLVNSTNDGVLDYINNNLEALHDAQIANTEYVQGELTNYLPLSGGTMTGVLTNNGSTSIPINIKTTGTDYRDIQIESSDGNHRIAAIRASKTSEGRCEITIGASTTSNEAPTGITISRSTTNIYATAPTPDATDNSKKIATTEFVNAKAGNYLPLSGGTMRGTITTIANPGLKVRDNDSYLVLCGASSHSHGAHMLLNGENRPKYEGTFGIVANDGSGGYVVLAGKPDGTLTWGNQPLLPVGVVQAFAGSTIPTGWLLCDGSAVSRTTYANLYACIGTTYGAGDGSTTFNLPNLTDKFIQGSATAGTVKSAGLPNITGSIGGGTGAGGPAGKGSGVGFLRDTMISGCFQPSAGQYGNETGVGGGTLPSGNPVIIANLDASRSSSVYGKSTTVQPPALTMRYIIKY